MAKVTRLQSRVLKGVSREFWRDTHTVAMMAEIPHWSAYLVLTNLYTKKYVKRAETRDNGRTFLWLRRVKFVGEDDNDNKG